MASTVAPRKTAIWPMRDIGKPRASDTGDKGDTSDTGRNTLACVTYVTCVTCITPSVRLARLCAHPPMPRSDISFPLKDAELREDVHTLGALVGELIREQGG